MLAEYHPLKNRALWCTMFLIIHGMVAIAAIVSTYAEIDLLSRIERGEHVPVSEATSSDERQSTIGMIYTASLVLAVIAFIVWMHRAYKNLAALEQVPNFATWWPIFGWVIPIMSLFRPYQVMKELYGASSPAVQGGRATTPLMPWWWGAWLASGWIGTMVAWAFLRGEEARDFIVADQFDIGSHVIWLVGLVLALILVHRITSNQQAKYEAKSTAITRQGE